MPQCKSILVLAVPYSKPSLLPAIAAAHDSTQVRGRVAAYAWGEDYHRVLPKRLHSLIAFIDAQVGRQIRSRWFTDAAPILERDLAQRAGLGWIGKNTCLINPRIGSYVLLAEIFLELELQPDPPFAADQCGTCRRCTDACPTRCILADRTLDSRMCISYLTIEHRDSIPADMRPTIGNWIFGCDICQMVCPWNRFAPDEGDEAFAGQDDSRAPLLLSHLLMPDQEFRRRFGNSPVKRAKYAGYLRNLAVAAGNTAGPDHIPTLRMVAEQGGALAREHAEWAVRKITERVEPDG